jgi:hypothetical protein
MNYDAPLHIDYTNERLMTHFYPTVETFIDWTPSDYEPTPYRLYINDGGPQLQERIANLVMFDNYDLYTKDVKPPVVNAELAETIQAEQIAIEYDTEGLMFDYTAHQLGEENCMINVHVNPMDKHILWLAVPVSAAVHLEPNFFAQRGAALIGIIESFQSLGIDVGVLGFDGTRAYEKIDFQVVQIKAPHNDINRTTMINMLSDAAVTSAIALSRGLSFLKANGGGDVNLDERTLVKCNPDIKAENVMIISSSQARELAKQPNKMAQELHDAAARQLLNNIKKGA